MTVSSEHGTWGHAPREGARGFAQGPGATRALPVIGLDWGSSRLRAYRIDAGGRVLERRAGDHGAIGLSGGEFDAVLVRTVGDWAAADGAARLIACGMVGARGGWAEAPYVDLPAGVSAIRERVVEVPTSLGRPLAIVGGLRTGEPDVLRGEETQALGCGVTDAVLCMPGTHSKWLRIRSGTVESFATWLTGELFELLGAHGSLAKAFGAPCAQVCAPAAAGLAGIDAAAFEAGVFASGESDWLHQLFLFRARVVGQGAPGTLERSRLSGWLLGCELRQALLKFEDAGRDAPILLVAEPGLAALYRRALEVLEHGRSDARHFECADADCAARGLYRIANGL